MSNSLNNLPSVELLHQNKTQTLHEILSKICVKKTTKSPIQSLLKIVHDASFVDEETLPMDKICYFFLEIIEKKNKIGDIINNYSLAMNFPIINEQLSLYSRDEVKNITEDYDSDMEVLTDDDDVPNLVNSDDEIYDS